MLESQKLKVKSSELAEKINALSDDAPVEERSALETEATDTEKQWREAVKTESEVEERAKAERTNKDDGENKELVELRSKVKLTRYASAALAGVGVSTGAEAEYNQHRDLAPDWVPMELLMRGLETRAARDGDGEASQSTWVQRVMDGRASEMLGVSYRSLPVGTYTVPAVTAGGSGAQRGRSEAVTESTYTIAVTELKPTRHAVYGIASIEDMLRLPGYEDALLMDMRDGVAESMDKAIFLGDDGANENVADITGFNTLGITERTITQTNKVLAAGVMAAFGAMIDGGHAMSTADLRVVLSEGANSLWMSTIPGEANGGNRSIAETMRGNGINSVVRGGVETATANGDFGAFVGLGMGIEDAAVAAIWDAGQLVRVQDTTRAAAGEVGLVLSAYWDFALVRASSFNRIKFVS